MTPEDASARRPVWDALAGFYLDTDVEGFYPHAVRVLADSGYTLDELRDILCREVHPALHPNLLSVAGEWAGFDRDWLAERIQRRLARPRWLRGVGCVLCGMPKAIWARLGPMVAAERMRHASPPA